MLARTRHVLRRFVPVSQANRRVRLAKSGIPAAPAPTSTHRRSRGPFPDRTPYRPRPPGSVPRPVTARAGQARRRAGRSGPSRFPRRYERGRDTRRLRPEDIRAASSAEFSRPARVAVRPRRMRSGSQRARFCSSSTIGSPDGLHAGRETRRLNFHECDQAVDLGLERGKLGQDSAKPERVLAEGGPHPVVAGGRGVAFIEDEVNDLEHRCQAGGQFMSARDLERDLLFGQCPLGPHDALGDRRLGHKERPRDLRRSSGRRAGGASAQRAPRSTARDGRL